MSDVTVSKVQKHSNSSAIDDAAQTALFSEIETAGKTSDSDNDIDMVLEKLGIPIDEQKKLKKVLNDAGKTSYADILDYLDSDDDGTVETSEITNSIKSDDSHGENSGKTRNGTNAFDTTESRTSTTSTSTSTSKSTTAKTSRDTDQNDVDYVDKMFKSTSGKDKNSFFKQDLEAFLKPESGKAPDEGKLALILQKMGFAKKDDAGNPVPNNELAAEIIDYFKTGDNDSFDEGDFDDLLDMLMGDYRSYETDEAIDDKNSDVALRTESENALNKFINDMKRNTIDQGVKDSIVRVDVDGKIVSAGTAAATPRNPADEADDVYLNRIFKLNEGKPANSFLQDDIKAFMYNSDSSVIDEAKLATLLKTMGITQKESASPTELAKGMIAYIKNMQSAGTAQEKLIDLLSGRNSDFKSNIGNKDDTIIESSETLSVLTSFINSDKAGDAKNVTILPDVGSVLTDIPTTQPIADRITWEPYLKSKGIISGPQDFDNFLLDVKKANNDKPFEQLTADDIKAFFDNDKSGDGVSLAEALLSRFSNSNNGFAISPSGLRAYLETSGDSAFKKGQLLTEYLYTIGINPGDTEKLKNILVTKSNEEIVAFLTAGQADGGKLIPPSQIQKNIMAGGNLPKNETDIITGLSGGGVYKGGGGATSDTKFSGLSDDEMANALKNGLIDVKTYLNMDNPSTSDKVEDFNSLPFEEKEKRLNIIQKSRGKKLDDLYPQELIGRKLIKDKQNEYEDTVAPNKDARLGALTLEHALLLTGTDSRAIADAHINDTNLYKMKFKKNDINQAHYKSDDTIEMYSSDAFRAMAMQYSTEELKNGKLKAILTPLFKEIGRSDDALNDIVKQYKEDLDKNNSEENKVQAFNTMIGKVFVDHRDADYDQRDNRLFTKEDMQ